MGVSVTLMLAVTVFMLLVAQMIPESSTHTAVVNVYFMFCLVLVTLVIISLCMVSRLYYRSKIDPPMGKWTRKYIFGKLSFILGARQDVEVLLPPDTNEVTEDNREHNESYTLEEEWAIVGKTADNCLFVLFMAVFLIGTICCFA